MKANVFLKSVLRQPLRALVLVVLLGVAAFAFALRVTEYAIVSEEIGRIEGHYRSIGFLQSNLNPWESVNVGADLLADSPFIDFHNRQRILMGVMDGVKNANIPTTPWGIENGAFTGDAYFFGEIVEVSRVVRYLSSSAVRGGGPNRYFMQVQIMPDYVITGFSDLVISGRVINLLLPLQDNILFHASHGTPFNPCTLLWSVLSFDPEGTLPIADMEVGGRYLFRAAFYDMVYMHRTAYPTIRDNLSLLMKPLDAQTGLWYLPAPLGAETDISFLYEQIAITNENIHSMRIRTTTDMSAMPNMQYIADDGFLVEGRLIDHYDYLNANHVMVIHREFARFRNIGIGDTISFNVRDMSGDASILIHDRTWRDAPSFQIELEVVGIYAYDRLNPRHNTPSNSMSVFVPDSVIPAELQSMPILHPSTYSFVLNTPRDEDAFMVNYSPMLAALGLELVFVEHDGARFFASADPIIQSITVNVIVFTAVFVLVLALVAFIYGKQSRQVFAVLRALGMPAKTVVWQNFVPALLLWIPLMFVGIYFAWGFAHTLAGDTLAGLLDVNYYYYYSYYGYYSSAGLALSGVWLAGITIIAIAAILLSVAIGNILTARKPVLELLQGGVAKVAKTQAAVKELESMVAMQATIGEPTQKTPATSTHTAIKPKNRRRNIIFFTIRRMFLNIIRSPIKTALAAVVAMFFLLSLGFLNEMMERTALEIDHLYDTTVITAEIRQQDLGIISASVPMNNFVFPITIEAMTTSEMVVNYYISGGFPQHVLVVPNPDGSFPEGFWVELFGEGGDDFSVIGDFGGMDWIYAPNCLEGFVERNQPGITDAWLMTTLTDAYGNFVLDEYGQLQFIPAIDAGIWPQVTLKDGFTYEDFVFTQNTPIPAVINERRLVELGLEVGDYVFTGFGIGRELTPAEQNPQTGLDSGPFLLRIVGSYNGVLRGFSPLMPSHNRITIIPLAALQYIRYDLIIGYTHAAFDINPAMNRDMDYVRAYIDEILSRRLAGFVPLAVTINDSALRYVVGPMEQNLNLLEILYPIALTIAFILSAGLSLLLMLQNAKIAAILRVLGNTKTSTRLILILEQTVVCIFGIALGLVTLPIFGISFGTALAILIALYLSGAIIGATSGAISITNKSPLDLLQVKE
ncbi:MAG: hypothetical protein FWB74_02860 [Defluviitaleaceae bacterium]|nr:hypothetical protein [Defluviitaleaceae bacterium]